MSDFPAATPACLHSSLHSNRRMLRKCESDTSPSLGSNAFPSRQSSGPSPDNPLTPHVSSFRLAHVTPGVWSDSRGCCLFSGMLGAPPGKPLTQPLQGATPHFPQILIHTCSHSQGGALAPLLKCQFFHSKHTHKSLLCLFLPLVPTVNVPAFFSSLLYSQPRTVPDI